MMHVYKGLFTLALVAGLAAMPTLASAESASKGSASSGAKSSSGASDDFEENRRAHMQKSKENNANKGAN